MQEQIGDLNREMETPKESKENAEIKNIIIERKMPSGWALSVD